MNEATLIKIIEAFNSLEIITRIYYPDAMKEFLEFRAMYAIFLLEFNMTGEVSKDTLVAVIETSEALFRKMEEAETGNSKIQVTEIGNVIHGLFDKRH